MKNSDFELSESDLGKLNRFAQRIARSHYAGEGEPAGDLTVTFHFGPPFGRMVMASVAGSEAVDLDDITD